MLMASCTPDVIPGGSAEITVTQDGLQNCFIIDGQYSDATCKTAQNDGNYIKYHTSPATTVRITNTKTDGSENVLAVGASGVFNITPKRGNSPVQSYTVSAINQDASIISFTSSVTVYVPADLAPEVKFIAGDSGTKRWTWASDTDPVWGNAGNTGNGASFTAGVVDGQWWGCSPEGLLEQLDHSGGVETGAESPNAYMIFDEDGNITTFGGDGTQLYKSSYVIADYDANRASGWQLAKLQTASPAVLFPYSINEGGVTVTEFDLMYLDANDMTLVYTKGNGAGSWGEITWWKFKNASDYEGALTNYDSRKWGWAYEDAPVWGNAGNSGNGAGFTAGVVDGQWWGATPAELLGQLDHSGGVEYGDEDFGAYMIFSSNGTVNTYKADGTKIRGGEFSVDDFDINRHDNWQLGTLNTTEPAILFPWSINEGGTPVTSFDLMYIDGHNMTLVYTKGNGAGSWGEISWWKLAPKD